MEQAITIQKKQWAMEKKRNGRIRTAAKSRSNTAIRILLLALGAITILAFLTFDYKDIDLGRAVADTLSNFRTVFFSPHLSRGTVVNLLHQLFITFCLGVLSTILGMILAFFCALLCARNIADDRVSGLVKSVVALVRAIPTVLWVLIFAVSAGLGSVAAVVGLTFHSFAYLTKVYAESIEEIDEGTIEALKACGAGFGQIVTQAILPSSLSSLIAWTFMRFEINFTNAIAMGAAAGAGGIGFDLYMAGSFYFDLHEMGFLTYVAVITVVVLELISTKIKLWAK